ncbi:sigma-70 family RNA polymerase sigma factor [Brevibacillus composti]|uniref:Sigma-70 family RNA polymerase sigma factor n=1 Tax=Brevibacillus composti TaxID=2796470 RepID=A0A7T5JPS4_9BACL|nr:sigma-70 family RNA polymerase sigma factor [Brevibacillus composti]QQE75748.1 sigma-70 family RNA polymerase sigma factor [Brevibacillus composti]QUO42774.1 sigma-70 family RNA polymerase sigma factor [Brevibacillus composti]
MFYNTSAAEQQFNQIYQAYHKDVYHFLYCFTGNRGDAEDLTQETFIRVAASLSKFEGRAHLKTWMIAIAKNLSREWARKKRLSSFFTDVILRNMPAEDGLPEPELETKESYKQILAGLQKLKPQYRTVIILRLIEEYSVKETAEILSCTEIKVKVDFHRAIKKLQNVLEPDARGEWKNVLAK